MGIALTSTFAQYPPNGVIYVNPGAPPNQYFGNLPQNYQQPQQVQIPQLQAQGFLPAGVVPSAPAPSEEQLKFQNLSFNDVKAAFESFKNSNAANSQDTIENKITSLADNLTQEEQDGFKLFINFFKNLGLKDKYDNLKQTVISTNNTFLQRIITFVEGIVQTALRVLSVLTLGLSERIMNAIHKIFFSHSM